MSVIHKAAKVAQEVKKKQKRNYVQEFKDEMRKVSWTTKEELVVCTKIVIGSTFAFGIGIYVVDLILKGAIDGLHSLVLLIGN